MDIRDNLHLLHVNVVRAIMNDPEDAIVQLTWVRIQHIIAMKDTDAWKIDSLLKESSPRMLIGTAQFLMQKTEERNNDLRLSRQASYMQSEDCRDIRDHFSCLQYFKVEHLLCALDEISHHGSIDRIIQRNITFQTGKRNVKA